MSSLLTELRRRNVFKVGMAYAVVGWLLIEVASTVLPTFEAPAWVLQTITFVIMLGFPLALVLSWVFDLTPGGIERTQSAAVSGAPKSAGRRLDFVIIGVLVLSVGYLLIDNYLPESDEAPGGTDVPAPAVVDEQREILPNSVAVLLCDNLSPDPDDAYFAASIHEEILNQLVKIRALNVIARTSVLQYADAPPPIPQIADELNVGAVMECSVRYAGDAIMVTAQLIDPETNSHLWSDAYPGDLSDLSTVFAMQADIAMNIANALEAEFSDVEQESIDKVPTSVPAAYSYYLRSLPLGGSGIPGDLAVEYLDEAIALDPEFALAYAAKALRFSFRGRGAVWLDLNWQSIAQEAAERALEIDPDLAAVHAALGDLHAANWRWSDALRAYERAYELNPNDVRVLGSFGTLMRDIGENEEAIRLFQRISELDPNIPNGQLSISYRYAKDYDRAAIAEREALAKTQAPGNYMHLGIAEILRGNREEGLSHLQTAEQLFGDEFPSFRIAQIAYAYSYLDRPEDVERLFEMLGNTPENDPVSNGMWAMAYLALHDYEQAHRYLEAAVVPGEPLLVVGQLKANDFSSPVLEEPRFRELRDRIGALD